MTPAELAAPRTVGLHLTAVPAAPEQTNRNGKVTRAATTAHVRCTTTPATTWTETDPDRLDAAADELHAAANWLREQNGQPPRYSDLEQILADARTLAAALAQSVDDLTDDERAVIARHLEGQ